MAVKNNQKTNIFFRKTILGKMERKQELFNKFRIAMYKMKKFGLSFEDVITSNIIAQTSFYSPSSYAFIQYIKRNKQETALDLLNTHRRLIFEYDNVWQNAYHIAAKRGYVTLLYELIHYKGDIDAYDMTGRSPVMWALESNNLICVNLLLAAGAYPFVTESEYLKNSNLSGEAVVMINKAKKLNVIMHLITNKNKNKLYK